MTATTRRDVLFVTYGWTTAFTFWPVWKLAALNTALLWCLKRARARRLA